MNALIIGCGYLGRRVAARWLAEGRHVVATTRSSARAGELRREDLDPVVCDVTEPGSLRHLPAAATVLYSVGFDRGSGRSMREVYVTGLSNVLAALPLPERFLHVSSTSVYGQMQGEEVDESSPTEPLDESGHIVLEAEQLLRRTLPTAVMLRFGGIYGPGRLLRAESLRAGEPLKTDPDKWLNLIHVEDGAAAVLAAEARARPGAVYNVCDDQPVLRRDFYDELARLLGAPPPRFAPPGPGDRPLRHELSNRRVLNRRLRQELQVVLRYPSYREGLAGLGRDEQ